MSGRQCPYCDRVFDELAFQDEHIVPKSKGGSDGEENKIKACQECNRIKDAWNVDCVVGPNATREVKIKTIRDFLKWKKRGGRTDSDSPYMKG